DAHEWAHPRGRLPRPHRTRAAHVSERVMDTVGTFTPAAARRPLSRIVGRQSAMEIALTLRRGESLVLTLVIPVLLLVGAAKLDALRLPADRVGFLVPGVLALAVMWTGF